MSFLKFIKEFFGIYEFSSQKEEEPKKVQKKFVDKIEEPISTGKENQVKKIKTKKYKKVKIKGDTILVNEEIANKMEDEGKSVEKELIGALKKTKAKKAKTKVDKPAEELYTKEEWNRTFLEKKGK